MKEVNASYLAGEILVGRFYLKSSQWYFEDSHYVSLAMFIEDRSVLAFHCSRLNDRAPHVRTEQRHEVLVTTFSAIDYDHLKGNISTTKLPYRRNCYSKWIGT